MARELLQDVKKRVSELKSCVEQMKQLSAKMEELSRLQRSGEVHQSLYEPIRSEVNSRLMASFKSFLQLRDDLEVDRVKMKLEWARLKLGLREVEESMRRLGVEPTHYSFELRHEGHGDIVALESCMKDVEEALGLLSFESELSLYEHLASLFGEGAQLQPSQREELEKIRDGYLRHLDSILRKWAQMRQDKVRELESLQAKASRIDEEAREVEARFMVRELEESEYEGRMSRLRGVLKEVKENIHRLRSYIDDVDVRMFRCMELVRGKRTP